MLLLTSEYLYLMGDIIRSSLRDKNRFKMPVEKFEF